MTLKELPEGTDLTKIKLVLPDNILTLYQEYWGGEKEMYIVGELMGDFFMSPNSKEEENRRLYPLPASVLPIDMLDWQVVE